MYPIFHTYIIGNFQTQCKQRFPSLLFCVTIQLLFRRLPAQVGETADCRQGGSSMYQITDWCRHFVQMQVTPGDLCIDATMGNGHDTELLCRLAGEHGKVLAFDIQEKALQNTKKRLQKAGVPDNYRLILDSHSHMIQYADAGSVSCILFNFGYLPGADHSTATQPETSLQAIRQGLSLLKKDGLMSLCIYSGGDTGFEERDTLLSFLKALDSRQYLVVLSSYYNRPNHPPIPVLVRKLL